MDDIMLDPTQGRVIALDRRRRDMRRAEGNSRPELVVLPDAYSDPGVEAVSLAGVLDIPNAVRAPTTEGVDTLGGMEARADRIAQSLCSTPLAPFTIMGVIVSPSH